MFARIKKSGRNEYLQLVQNRREGKKTIQRVVATIGRMDELRAGVRSKPRAVPLPIFREGPSDPFRRGNADVQATAKKIGPALIFERLWQELEIGKIIRRILGNRKFEFDVERAIFLTVLHRLFVSGSDRSCDKWHRDHRIAGVEALCLHHLYRAMAFLGEETEDQKDCTPFAPRCTKDVIEEDFFHANSDLFTGMDLFFFDTTSIYFEGEGGETIGQRATPRITAPT